MAQQEQAQSLGEVVGLMQRKASEAEAAAAAAEAPAEAPGSGFFIAPRVRFSDRLWTKLGGKAREADRQGRRERMTDATAMPSPRFDYEFRRDSLWKQRELRIRQAYVEHLENLTLQKEDEKEALQMKVMQQVAGVYKQAEDDAIQRLSDNVADLQAKTVRPPALQPVCETETQVVLQCYKDNPKNPLPCWDFVAALDACARKARQKASV